MSNSTKSTLGVNDADIFMPKANEVPSGTEEMTIIKDTQQFSSVESGSSTKVEKEENVELLNETKDTRENQDIFDEINSNIPEIIGPSSKDEIHKDTGVTEQVPAQPHKLVIRKPTKMTSTEDLLRIVSHFNGYESDSDSSENNFPIKSLGDILAEDSFYMHMRTDDITETQGTAYPNQLFFTSHNDINHGSGPNTPKKAKNPKSLPKVNKTDKIENKRKNMDKSQPKKKAKVTENPKQTPKQMPETKPELESEDVLYEVEKIINHVVYRGKVVRYEIKWLGYPDSGNTQEPAEVIHGDCPQICIEYWSTRHPKPENIPIQKSKKNKHKTTSSSELKTKANPIKPSKYAISATKKGIADSDIYKVYRKLGYTLAYTGKNARREWNWKELDSIYTVRPIANKDQMLAMVNWKTGDRTAHLVEELHEHAPSELIKFYEKSVLFLRSEL
ncbi:hypothetical protein CLU79DRAFT_545261 [Phycomyces nitens]|nr:hypothetical protein CLU79DRAFT_545261 [Phycomyces nitens]